MKTIKQKVVVDMSAHEVYSMLMDSKKHSMLTGEDAKISKKVGGKFSAYSGYAEGENIELIPDKKIVQSWRASDWPKGHYSELTLTFSPAQKGTTIELVQKNVPDEQAESIKSGWTEFYWNKMK